MAAVDPETYRQGPGRAKPRLTRETAKPHTRARVASTGEEVVVTRNDRSTEPAVIVKGPEGARCVFPDTLEAV